jgi:hypothetical protein
MQAGQSIKVGSAVVRKVQDAQPMGNYVATAVDAAKRAVDFRLTDIGSKNTIIWKDGKVEMVTDRTLEKLQAKHTWAPDF